MSPHQKKIKNFLQNYLFSNINKQTKQTQVNNKLQFIISPKGSLKEDNPYIFQFFLSIFLLASYTPKFNLTACLILETAMKKTLNLEFWRRPQT